MNEHTQLFLQVKERAFAKDQKRMVAYFWHKKESTVSETERLRGSMALNKGEEADEAIL